VFVPIQTSPAVVLAGVYPVPMFNGEIVLPGVRIILPVNVAPERAA